MAVDQDPEGCRKKVSCVDVWWKSIPERRKSEHRALRQGCVREFEEQ